MGWSPEQNRWGPGGDLYAALPWGRQGPEYGWQQAGDYFQAKTASEIREEALLQLAVLAVVAAAPALIKAVGGMGAKGMGAAAEAASAGGQAGLAQQLLPFAKAGALAGLSLASQMGKGVLNQALHQGGGHSFVFEPAPKGDEGRGLDVHPGVGLVERVAERIGRSPMMMRGLGQMARGAVVGGLAGRIEGLVREAAEEIGNVWGVGGLGVGQVSISDPSDCSGFPIERWMRLLKFRVPYSVYRSIEERNRFYHALTWKWSIQNLEDDGERFNADRLNLDYYEVMIEKLPLIKGEEVQPNQILKYWHNNFNEFLDQEITTFGAYSDEDLQKWESDSPLGAVMRFDVYINPLFKLNVDDGSVVVSDVQHSHWTFTTILTPDDHRHPVSGHRRFGYNYNADGSVSFYVMAVDRLTTNIEGVMPDQVFGGADELWRGWQHRFAEKINQLGGKAVTYVPIARRCSWNFIQAKLKAMD